MSVFLQASVYKQARLPAPQEVIANRLSCTSNFSALYTCFGQFSTMSKSGSPSQDNIQREKGKNRISVLNWKYITEIAFNERTVEFDLQWSNITKL
jgi:hypothetical protein